MSAGRRALRTREITFFCVHKAFSDRRGRRNQVSFIYIGHGNANRSGRIFLFVFFVHVGNGNVHRSGCIFLFFVYVGHGDVHRSGCISFFVTIIFLPCRVHSIQYRVYTSSG